MDEKKVIEVFECRICWTAHDEIESAEVCCNPVKHTFISTEDDQEFDSLEEASKHVHGKALQKGEAPLAEWATALQIEQSL